MNPLSDFQNLINEIKDEELLNVAEDMLRDMIEIQNMKEKIEKLEEGLSDGKRASFWFFAMGLNREQVDLATNAVIGRKRHLKDQDSQSKKQVSESKEKELPLSI